MIAAKNHKNGCDNPYAQMQKDLGYEFCRNVSEKNPVVAGPLKRTDCSLVSDGAAAIVLADVDTALRLDKAVYFRAHQQVQDRSEEHTSELQSLMRISTAVFCLKKKTTDVNTNNNRQHK